MTIPSNAWLYHRSDREEETIFISLPLYGLTFQINSLVFEQDHPELQVFWESPLFKLDLWWFHLDFYRYCCKVLVLCHLGRTQFGDKSDPMLIEINLIIYLSSNFSCSVFEIHRFKVISTIGIISFTIYVLRQDFCNNVLWQGLLIIYQWHLY